MPAGTGGLEIDPASGRVLSLWPGPDTPNLLFEGEIGPGLLGGDRCWLAPETELFYQRPGDPGSPWRCPPELDPGSWEWDGAVLRQTALGARLTRRITPLPAGPIAGPLLTAGYTVTDQAETDQPWAPWHLVVLPLSGDIWVRAAADPLVYYPPAPAVRDGWLVFDRRDRWKAGFAPPPDGRVVLAAMAAADPGALVVVTTELKPGLTCVDTAPDGSGAAPVQVFANGPAGLCELEHHAALETGAYTATVVGAWGSRAERSRLLTEMAGTG